MGVGRAAQKRVRGRCAAQVPQGSVKLYIRIAQKELVSTNWLAWPILEISLCEDSFESELNKVIDSELGMVIDREAGITIVGLCGGTM